MAAGERGTSQHLDVIRPQTDRALRGLANERKDFDQQLLAIRPGDGPRADVSGPGAQVVITLGREPCSLGRDFAGELPKWLEVDLGEPSPPAAKSALPSILPTGLRGGFLCQDWLSFGSRIALATWVE